MKRFVPFACIVLIAGGCVTRPPVSALLDPIERASRFDARSFNDPKLRAFLQENLARLPETDWDFEALSWAAFYFHPSLGVARAQWATARASQLTAKQRPNPTLVFTPGYNSTREPGLGPWFPAINLDFLFQSTDKRARQQAIAEAESEATRLAVVAAAWQVRSELRRALADSAVSERRAELLRAQADAQRQLLKLLEQRFSAGSIAATDVAVTRTVALRADAAASDAAAQVSLARGRVAAAIGVPVTALAAVKIAPLTTPAELTSEQLALARREALRSRSDVLSALAKYVSTRAALDLEYAKRAPDFHLGPGYQWDQNANKWTIAVSFELPLLNRNEGPIAEATARRDELAAQFDLVQAQAISAIDLAIETERAARSQVERAQQLRRAVESEERQAQRRAELGSADRLEVETANIDVSLADVTVLDAENALVLARGQLEDALQVPFSHLASLTAKEPTTLSAAP